ncbi:IQ motif and SEC7 domain-containing protein 3-like [Grus japonensis]|uniref:IQ motif and SEC7 domain-containing protein 3-like n=1 Tax=Grus japonensis TaxID=30415 RepID=A0ABC9XAM9_GRUJA
MESPVENPSKAAEYLKELNKIIETQQELLEKQKRRIDELEQQVAKLYHENACLQDEHHRHLATCRLQQGVPPAYPGVLSAIQENAKHEKSEGESSRSIRSLNTLHQFCCPAPLYHTQLAVPATHSEYSVLNRSTIIILFHRDTLPPSQKGGPGTGQDYLSMPGPHWKHEAASQLIHSGYDGEKEIALQCEQLKDEFSEKSHFRIKSLDGGS